MNPNTNEAELARLHRWVTWFKIAGIVHGIGLIFLIGLCWKMANNQRNVISPPVLREAIWVAGQEVSKSYLEQMGNYVLNLSVNSTPSSALARCDDLITLAAPDTYGPLKNKCQLAAKRLARDSASTLFSPLQVVSDVQTLSVAFTGSLSTFIGDRRVSDMRKTYAVEFLVGGDSRLYVKTIKETCDEDPFGLIPSGDGACRNLGE